MIPGFLKQHARARRVMGFCYNSDSGGRRSLPRKKGAEVEPGEKELRAICKCSMSENSGPTTVPRTHKINSRAWVFGLSSTAQPLNKALLRKQRQPRNSAGWWVWSTRCCDGNNAAPAVHWAHHDKDIHHHRKPRRHKGQGTQNTADFTIKYPT